MAQRVSYHHRTSLNANRTKKLKHHFKLQSNDELHSPDIKQTTNEPGLLELDYAQVHVDAILCLANKPFEDKLEQLQAVFQRISINATAAFLTRAAWKYSGYLINQGRNQLATRNTHGIRQMSEHELCCFGRIPTCFQTMGMQGMPILSPMARVPSRKNQPEVHSQSSNNLRWNTATCHQ
jgi:hypothetical protein